MAYFVRREKLKHDLGFSTQKEIKDYTQTWNFKPLFDHYRKHVIDPQMREAAAYGQTGRRGFSLQPVRSRMIEGRREGAWFDLELWEAVDFTRLEQTAYIMHRLIVRSSTRDGPLKGRNMNVNEQFSIMWRLLKKVESNYIARQKREAESSQQTATEARQPQQLETLTENSRITLPADNEDADEEEDDEFEEEVDKDEVEDNESKADTIDEDLPRRHNAAAG